MSRATIVLTSDAQRNKAAQWVHQAPSGTRVDFKAPRRSLPQNDRLWAMLSDIAQQVSWHGRKLTPPDWKIVFMAALKREVRMVPNIEGDGFVELGWSSSDLSKSEFSELIELIFMFGAKHGVRFGAEEKAA